MAEEDVSTLSIEQAFDKGMEETAPENERELDKSIDDSNSAEEPLDESTTEDEEEGQDGDQEEEESEEGEGEEGTQTKVTPDQKKGEYTKERFDGLMSKWQQDRSVALRVPQLEKELSELKGLLSDPNRLREIINQNDPASQDIEIPPELRDADENTIMGYKLMMKGVQKNMITKNDVEKMIYSTLNKPLEEHQKEMTAVMRECDELATEIGQEFIDHKKEILEFAGKKNLPLGSLRQAFDWWKEVKQVEQGRKVLKEVDTEKAREAGIPTSGVTRTNVIPKFDPERDGKKSLDEIWEEAKQSL